MSCDRMLAREIEKREREVRRLREQREFEMLRVRIVRQTLISLLLNFYWDSTSDIFSHWGLRSSQQGW